MKINKEVETKRMHQSYRKIVWNNFRKNKPALWSLRIVYFLFFIALFSDFIANDKPFFCTYKGETYFPVFHEYGSVLGLANAQQMNWKTVHLDMSVWPLVRYLPREMDFANAQYVSPGGEQKLSGNATRHLLGTDALGQDVFSGLIHGTRTALKVGIFSMVIASFLGILFGVLAGFFGDGGMKVSRARAFTGIVFLPLAFFYAFQCRLYVLQGALEKSSGQLALQLFCSFVIFMLVMFVGYLIAYPFKKIPMLGKRIYLPLDIIISRCIEVFNSIPRLLLIFSLIVLIRPSLNLVIIVIGLTSWTEIARFVRAEMIHIRKLEYIESATSLGYSHWRIILRHALPNAMAPILITISFGIASAILTESSLSFLGIGVPIDSLTWGKLLAASREAPQAWWLAVFPGIAIFIAITSFNLIGEGLTEAMDPKGKKN